MDAITWILNGGLTAAVVGVTVFFIKKWIRSTESAITHLNQKFEDFKEHSHMNTTKAVEKVMQDFSGITTRLQDIVTGLNDNVQSMEKLIAVLETSIRHQHEATTKTLSEHTAWLEDAEKTLKKHEVEISIIKATCRERVCK